MKTHDLGRAFWCCTPLRADAPLVHAAPMFQACWPYRQGTTFILKLPLCQKGLILGWWKKIDHGASEHDMLLKALRGHDLSERAPKYVGQRTKGCNLSGTLITSGKHYGLAEEATNFGIE